MPEMTTVVRQSVRAGVGIVLSFVALNLALLCVPDPAKFLVNWSANPGFLIMVTGFLFVLYAPLAWLALFGLIAWADAWADRRRPPRPSRGGGAGSGLGTRA